MMIQRLGISLTVLIAALQLATAGDEVKSDKALQGSWKAVKATVGGKEDKEAGKYRLIFNGDEFTLEYGGKEVAKGQVKVDASKTPKFIDLAVAKGKDEADKGKTIWGIYKVDGDKLTWCSVTSGMKDRPTDFEPKMGSPRLLMTLQRDKGEK
jgi:uncharacterized protein (TIGR03067 family)